jgi:Acyl-protein synthetase, LuxE
MTTPALIAEIAAYLAEPEPAAFEGLCRRAWIYQLAHSPPLRRLWTAQGRAEVEAQTLALADFPAIPVQAFKALRLCTAEPREVFRSSGTSAGAERRSVHYHPFPQLYRAFIAHSFGRACLPDPARRPILALIPRRRLVPDSSLSFLAEEVVRHHGDAVSLWALAEGGVDAAEAEAFCAARAVDHRPATILATSLALLQWLEQLEARDRTFRLPSGSTLFETGGTKGRRREIERDELLRRVERRLGLPAQQVVREYGMSELTGHFYTDVLAGGDPDLFIVPPAMQVRALEPRTLVPQPLGEPGFLEIFDLANVGSALKILTEDLGIVEAGGFRLLGRASLAELRGCSLTAEELGDGVL